MRYFPVFLDLDQREVLVVGGGEKALQKLRLLAKTTARLRLIAEHVDTEILAAGFANLTVETRPFAEDDVAGAVLVFAASDDEALDRRVSAAARAHGIAVNVVDGPADSSFIVPAIVDRDPVVVAIGTEGAAPVLAREIKARLEDWLPARFGHIAARAQALRQRIKDSVLDPVLRRRTWEALLQGPWREAALAGDDVAADRELERQMEAAHLLGHPVGSVTLIGCGPGEPDLITLKAQQYLQSADVLVTDRLVNPAILEYARRDAARIDVGKGPEGDSHRQDEINRILVREALKGHRVVRLKGGDAFVFGRAAEEMTSVAKAGIPVTVVPGITAAHACAASIGLPITQRNRVRQFTLVTGASAEGRIDLDWAALAQPGQAFAVYMGVRTADHFRACLLAAGADPDTPVVVVENGTLAHERVVETDLRSLVQAIADKGIGSPAVIFVGLDWSSAGLSRPARVEVYGTRVASAAVPAAGRGSETVAACAEQVCR